MTTSRGTWVDNFELCAVQHPKSCFRSLQHPTSLSKEAIRSCPLPDRYSTFRVNYPKPPGSPTSLDFMVERQYLFTHFLKGLDTMPVSHAL